MLKTSFVSACLSGVRLRPKASWCDALLFTTATTTPGTSPRSVASFRNDGQGGRSLAGMFGAAGVTATRGRKKPEQSFHGRRSYEAE
jgi:hypothetical protein